MPHLFQPYADTVARTVLLAILVGPFLAIGVAYWLLRLRIRDRPNADARPAGAVQPPASRRRARARLPLLPHRQSRPPPIAGVPPTHTCMTCHSQLYTQTAMLAPVRESLADNKPIHWNKVNRAARLRLLRSLDPHRQGRRLHHLSRSRRHHAADAAGGAADDGLVSRLPSQSGAESAGRRRRVRSGLAAARPTRTSAAPSSRIKISTTTISPIARSATDERTFPSRSNTKQATAPSAGIDRRAALKLFVSGAALALASCGRPAEQIVPYVEMPEGETPGVPLRFASALPLAGYGRGVIVTSVEGRPIKIDGNPRHPASLGATDVFAEATVLSLYDPDRSQGAVQRRPHSAVERVRGGAAAARSSGDDREAGRRACAADRTRHLTDFGRANRRADRDLAASEMVPLRAG